MRIIIAIAALALSACAAPSGPIATSTLAAADAATSLAVGQSITMETSSQAGGAGMDAVVNLTLRHADGRTLQFQEANHAPNDLIAQQPGGALAQIMGLFNEESPTLYRATGAEGAPFLCAPEGPRGLGVYAAPDGTVQIVGLKQEIEFETMPDGSQSALPFSPDQVCARLSFRRQ
jgi:hypothetical protein